MSEKGIKELLEVLHAIKSLAVDSIVHLKDGLSLDDISVLTANVGKLKDALEGIGEIPAEVKDLDAEEIKQLLVEGADLVFAIIGALPKSE